MFALLKIASWLLTPSNALLLLLGIGIAALWLGRRRWGRALATLALLLLLVPTLIPVTSWLARPLEDRYPPPTELPAVDGVIVLGGAVPPGIAAAREQPALNDGAERMTAFVALARRFPEAELVFSGGSSALRDGGATEADAARRFFDEQGLSGRVRFEAASRDTYENALFGYRLVGPAPEERWLLVTSALHMPRALNVFRRVGWAVTPYPVDYLTAPGVDIRGPAVLGNLRDVDRVASEWFAIVAFRLLGRTDGFLPPRAP